ncbi:MAG: pentapeptide repeat-containing protein, partial [Cyanobacteria bacterium J06582_2]
MLNDFVAWFKNPNPDTVLLKYWQRNRSNAKVVNSLEAKQQQEQDRQIIATQAYLLWEADGKPDGKDEYYWQLAIDHLKGNHFPTVYQPYYKLEKRVLEPVDAWIDKQAFFAILGKLGNLAVVVAIVTFVFGENIRRNNEVFSAWQTITSAHGQSGSGGRIKALEFLNSRPLRFPWVGWTKDLFWDEKTGECEEKLVFGRRWSRELLVGLSAPNKAYLSGINLCDAVLESANLQDADLWNANLQDAGLFRVNFQNTSLRYANLQNAVLEGANLRDANLWRANLRDAVLEGANLRDANLGNADLQNTNLWRANLRDAVLEGANLRNANLGNADLQDAVLEGVNLQNANLEFANLAKTQVKLACFWDKAIYKGELDVEQFTIVALEPDNTDYIKKLKQDISSNPQEIFPSSSLLNQVFSGSCHIAPQCPIQ